MPVDERVARSVALEQAYVHDVYEQFSDNSKSKPWIKVQNFLDDLEPGSIVCDVGCGNGKYLNINTSIFNIGGDKSTSLCELTREKEKEIIILDNLALPFRDESLDAVVSIAVVHHLATAERRICALQELARVLRIGGRIIISVWAMEQSHRKFESQDVLVPWHRPRHLSTPSLELTSTTNTSEDDGLPPYHAYTQTSDSDSYKSMRSKDMTRKKGKNKHKGRSIDPGGNSSPSSSSLSSPNETCYSFVRRAIQKLAGGRRVGVHRPWFLESWGACTKEPLQKRYDPDGCECYDCLENIQDLPIELRRIDDDDLPQRRQTFPSSQLVNDISNNLKSKSMTNFTTNNNEITVQNAMDLVYIHNSPELEKQDEVTVDVKTIKPTSLTRPKPKLVKQKKSICDEDAEEALDQPTDMDARIINLPVLRYHRGSVLKQRSLNEELMSTDRLKEKERVRQNIQKQASLNDDLIYQRSDTLKDSFFSVTTAKKFQLIKTGFTKKIKNSTTNIEKVTGASLKNGFVRMFQNWKSSELISPTILEDEESTNKTITNITDDMKKDGLNSSSTIAAICDRRHSKEDGSDSSKDSSLQSDTSVDSEDSFASVIFVPKSDPMSPTILSPGPTSPRLKTSSAPSPRIKQSSCPTSPRIKQMPLTLYPLTKQLSSPKPSTEMLSCIDKPSEKDFHMLHPDSQSIVKHSVKNLAEKYSVQQIPQFQSTSLNTPSLTNSTTIVPSNTEASPEKLVVPDKIDSRNERLKKIRDLLAQKPGFGVRNSKSNFPLVRQCSVSNGKVEAIAKPLPKLLTLELFNPETDDKDSDSSCVSSPDSIDSVINVSSHQSQNKSLFKFPPSSNGKARNLLEAAADVANSLDEAVDKVIKSTPKSKRRLQSDHMFSVIQRCYSSSSTSDTLPLLQENLSSNNWNEECHRYLTDFADKLSEKLLREIDQYQEKTRIEEEDSIDDPYIHRLSEELNDLSKLSAEIQKQNEYLAKLSASDSLFNQACSCNVNRCDDCKCFRAEPKHDALMEFPSLSIKEVSDGFVNKSATSDSLRNVNSDLCDIKSLASVAANHHGTEGSNETSSSSDLVSNSSKRSKTSIKMGASTDSCDSERGSSTNSMISSVATSINFGPSIESTDGCCSLESQKDSTPISRYSDGGGSTASLASCPEWKPLKPKSTTSSGTNEHIRLPKDTSSLSLESAYSGQSSKRRDNNSIVSDISQDSLPSDNIGGEITYHRYYHVFREGELDQLIEKYVENLHIISSYYDHSSWCIIAEKVQVWTI